MAGIAYKRLNLKIRIVLFLLCTIGILFISMHLFYKSEEGFSCSSTQLLFPGTNGRLCDTSYDAAAVFLDNTLNTTDAVCYLTPTATNSAKSYYTCYQRPPGETFSFNEGIYVQNKSSDDTTDTDITNNMAAACVASKVEKGKLDMIYNSTLAYQGVINGALTKVNDTITALSDISATKCPAGADSDPFCTALTAGIGQFQTLPLDTPGGRAGLISMSNTLVNSISQINTTKGDFTSAYNGYIC